MLIRTWGFVATKPHSPWVSVEVRAERGALENRMCRGSPHILREVWLGCWGRGDVAHLGLALGPKPTQIGEGETR